MAKAPKGKVSVEGTSEAFVEDRVAVGSLPYLAELLTATQGQPGYLFLSDEDRARFPAEFTDTNDAMKDENGNTATRLTDEGIEYAKAHPVTPSNDHSTTDAASGGNGGGGAENGNGRTKLRQSTGFTRPEKIEIDDAVPVPTATRSARTEPAYPFDKLNVGQSFHIPSTEKCPVPAKSVASSVTTAIRKYATPIKNEDGSNLIEEVAVRGKTEKQPRMVMKVERKFIIRTVGTEDARGPGCRVFRVDPGANDRIYAEL